MFPAQFDRLMAELRIIAPAIGRSICLEPVARRGWGVSRPWRHEQNAPDRAGGPDGAAPIFDKIGIVGLGLMGGSLALAAREVWPPRSSWELMRRMSSSAGWCEAR